MGNERFFVCVRTAAQCQKWLHSEITPACFIDSHSCSSSDETFELPYRAELIKIASDFWAPAKVETGPSCMECYAVLHSGRVDYC